jgi:predicted nucleic acid-binding protein
VVADYGQSVAPHSSEQIRYIESSALLAAILEREAAAVRAVRARGRRVTSVLTIAESQRALIRAHATRRIDATRMRAAARALRTFSTRCDLVSVTDEVLLRAGRSFPLEPVRTLDAIHLATAEILGEHPSLITIVTRDQRIRENALALGYSTE